MEFEEQYIFPLTYEVLKPLSAEERGWYLLRAFKKWETLERKSAFIEKIPLALIIHASVGSGHRSAALACAQGLDEVIAAHTTALPSVASRNTNTEEVLPAHQITVPKELLSVVIDILVWGTHVFDGDHSAQMFTGATRPLYDLTWRYSFTGRLLWGGGTLLSRVMWPRFTRFINACCPYTVIATHIMGANMAAGARILTKKNYPIISVPTDYETEGLWPHALSNAFCVGTESMAETLRPRHIPEHKIFVTGIPTRPAFLEEFDKGQSRQDLNLPADKRIVLALAGAYLQTPYVHFREILDQAVSSLAAHPNMHLIIVTGKDDQYATKLKKLCETYKLTNVTVLGYVSDMAKLMAASDLIICKSGGLTVTECLCARTPMILVGRAYGQEKANVIMLTSNGAATHVTTARELIDTLNTIDEHPERVHAMLVNAMLLRRPRAALDIAEISLKLAATHTQHNPQRRANSWTLIGLYLGDRPAHLR